MRRYVPVALSMLGYLAVLIGVALYDPRADLIVAGAIALYESREATRS